MKENIVAEVFLQMYEYAAKDLKKSLKRLEEHPEDNFMAFLKEKERSLDGTKKEH